MKNVAIRIFHAYKCLTQKEYFKNIVFYKRTQYNKFHENRFKSKVCLEVIVFLQRTIVLLGKKECCSYQHDLWYHRALFGV